MYLYLDIGRLAVYVFLGVLGYLGAAPWWVGVTVVAYDIAHYVVYIRIPWMKKPQPYPMLNVSDFYQQFRKPDDGDLN